jgi:hypothetical protein
MESDYPWDGRVRLTIEAAPAAAWTLALRVPAWCETATVRVNDTPAGGNTTAGYLRLTRPWQAGDVVELILAMMPRLVQAHPWIESTHGRVAIERGPLVYCVEHADQPHAAVADLEIDVASPLLDAWDPDRLDGVTVVRAAGREADRTAWDDHLYRPLQSAGPAGGRPVMLTAIPYYAWANREPGAMRVWIPRAEE